MENTYTYDIEYEFEYETAHYYDCDCAEFKKETKVCTYEIDKYDLDYCFLEILKGSEDYNKFMQDDFDDYDEFFEKYFEQIKDYFENRARYYYLSI